MYVYIYIYIYVYVRSRCDKSDTSAPANATNQRKLEENSRRQPSGRHPQLFPPPRTRSFSAGCEFTR